MGNQIALLGVGWFKSTAIFSESDWLRSETRIRPRNAMPSKMLFLVLIVATGCLWAQEQNKETPPPANAPTAASPHPTTISDADKARKNPVKFTEVSVDRGKKIYGTQCALCHGEKGDGKGDLAADMKLNLPDFTKADTLKPRSDGESLRDHRRLEGSHAVAGRPSDGNPPVEPGELSADALRRGTGEGYGQRA